MSFSFSVYTNASPCDYGEIKDILLRMKLDPEIHTNQDLMLDVNVAYGEKMASDLSDEHPFLIQSPDSMISKKTLVWVNDMIWSPSNKHERYIYIPGDLDDDGYNEFFVREMQGLLFSFRRTIPIFQRINSVEKYKRLLKKESLQELKKIMKKIHPTRPDKDIVDFATEYQEHFNKFPEYKVGFDFQPEQAPVILISGHSSAGTDLYIVGDEYVTAREMVTTIVKIGLTKNAILKLTGCFTGCTKEDSSLSIAEIKSKFFQGKLDEVYDNGQNKSFAKSFYQELKRQMPTFSGRVDGYIGGVSNNIEESVLSKDGKLLTAFGSHIRGKDGSLIVKREHARISFPQN